MADFFSFNKVTLMGQIEKITAMKTGAGKEWCSISLRTQEVYISSYGPSKTGKAKPTSYYHDISAWGSLASFATAHLGQGDYVLIEGRLRKFKGKDGTHRVNVNGESIIVLSYAPKDEGPESADAPQDPSDSGEPQGPEDADETPPF